MLPELLPVHESPVFVVQNPPPLTGCEDSTVLQLHDGGLGA